MEITTRTSIRAPIERVFDLARSMDFHTYSMRGSGESIIAGRTTGLLGIDESVIFKGRHFGFSHIFEAKITDLCFPTRFIDEMVAGSFTSFRHIHDFTAAGEQTVMVDTIIYRCPFGFLGEVFDRLFLHAYLSRLIAARSRELKHCSESNAWQMYLSDR